MGIEIGQIYNGTITGIKPYGVFLKLENDTSAFCHISQISNAFVDDISKFVNMDQEFKVKVIEITENKKINVSIKACENKIHKTFKRDTETSETIQERQNNENNKDTYQPKTKSFDELLSKYLKDSDDQLKSISNRTKKHTKR